MIKLGFRKGLALVNHCLWDRLLPHHEVGAFMFAVTIIAIVAVAATDGPDQRGIFV